MRAIQSQDMIVKVNELDSLEDEQLIQISQAVETILERRKRKRLTLDIEMGEMKAREKEKEEQEEALIRAINVDNQRAEMRESELAGGFVLSFGKHKGKSLADVDMAYLAWAVGFKRNGLKFMPDSVCGVRDRHENAYTQIQACLLWRCWVCRSTDVKFRTSKLCTSCYCSSVRK